MAATSADSAPSRAASTATSIPEVPRIPAPRRSLRVHLAYLSAALIILPAVVSGLLLGLGARQAVREEAFQHLQDVCNAKAGELGTKLEAWLSAVNRFGHRPLLRSNLELLIDPATTQSKHRDTRQVLDWMMYDLALSVDTVLGDALLLDLKGEPLAWYGLKNAAQARLAARQQPLADMLSHRRAGLGDAYLDPVTQQIIVPFSTVAYEGRDNTGPPIGIVLLRLYAPRAFYPKLQNVPYLGRSAELQFLDPQHRLLMDLRYQPGYLMQVTPGPLARRLSEQPEAGVMAGRDYRGVPSLAAASLVPYTGWKIIYKIDAAEALAGVAHFTTLWGLITLVLLLAGTFLAYLTARRIAEPVLEFGVIARRIAEGDLAARVHLPARDDELGLLAHDFNYMAERMTVSRNELEAEVRDRTADLRAANDRLARLNEELTAFTYTVSHDLTSPLVSLQGMTGMLLRDYSDKLGDEGKRRLGRLQANVQMMEALVGDLLELSRIGRVTSHVADIHLRGAVAQVLEALRESLLEANAETALPENDCQIRYDLNRLRQVLTNLVGNALKHRSPDRPLRLKIECQDDADRMLRVSVADNGIGIAPEFHEKVFLPFQRLQPATKLPGTGMGLTIVRKIVEHHGGKIWLESEPGQGSTFYFTAPRAGESNGTAAQTHPPDRGQP